MTRIGTVLSLPDLALAELAGGPLDFAWIDLEHGALGVRDVQALAIALQATGCEAHVRLPSWDSELLGPIVDAGVDGIVAPAIEHEWQAHELARRLRYPPYGTRGYGPRRAGDYGRTPAYWSASSAQVELTVQVETPVGVEAVEAIAASPGVDALVVGCADLSLALGAPGDLEYSALTAAVRRVAEAADQHGRRFGVAGTGDVSTLVALAELARSDRASIVFSADVRLYAQAVDAAAAALVTALGVEHG